MNCELTKQVTEEEIYKAIQQINENKSRKLNGLNVGFYKYNRKAIGKGVVDYVKHFLNMAFWNQK